MSRMSQIAAEAAPSYAQQEAFEPAAEISPARLDVAALWESLSDEDKAAIGVLALGSFVSGHTATRAEPEPYGTPAARAATAAHFAFEEWLAMAEMPAAVEAAIRDDAGFRIASALGPVCRSCGCSEADACEGGCGWHDEARTQCTACEARRPPLDENGLDSIIPF